MKKDIIISGPPASGKSRIATAIELTHNMPAFNTHSSFFATHFLQVIRGSLLKNSSILTIDECTIDQIMHFDHLIRSGVIYHHFPLSIIYITHGHVTLDMFDKNKFHIINCKNTNW